MKLIIHIGGGKCGSSASAKVLAENKHVLASFGILYPEAVRGGPHTGHAGFAQEVGARTRAPFKKTGV